MAATRADKVFGMGDSIAAESELEVIRSERAQRRKGGHTAKDIGEDEGCDFDAPENAADMGYALEPFNMRREKQEGDFDADGHYVHNIETLKAVTDKWLDTVDQGEKEAIFQNNKVLAEAKDKFNPKAAKLENPETLIQELATMLNQGENPTQALKRFAGELKPAPAGPKLPHEKRKEKAQQAAKAAAPKAKKGPRKKLTEFGDYIIVGAAEDDKAAAEAGEKNSNAENKSTNVPEEEAKSVKRPAEDMPPPKRPRKDDSKNRNNDRVTEICDQLLQQGYFDVYQTPAEKLGEMEKATPDLEPDEDDDDDEDEEKGKKKKGDKDSDDEDEGEEIAKMAGMQEEQEEEEVEDAEMADGEGGDILDLLGDMQAEGMTGDSELWQYKWTADGEVFGPFKTEQIYAWKSGGMFMGDGVLVRQIDADGNPIDEWQNMKSDVQMPAA
jgi:hypothetical protein